MSELCVGHGLCGSEVHVHDLLPETGMLTADRFATLLMKSEKATREYDRKYYDRTHALAARLFVENLGADKIEIGEIRSDRANPGPGLPRR